MTRTPTPFRPVRRIVPASRARGPRGSALADPLTYVLVAGSLAAVQLLEHLAGVLMTALHL